MNFVLAAGGTGGHMIPAHALAAELKSCGHGVLLITDERGARFPGLFKDVPVHILPAGRLGGGPLGLLKAAGAVLKGRGQAKRLSAIGETNRNRSGTGAKQSFSLLSSACPASAMSSRTSRIRCLNRSALPSGRLSARWPVTPTLSTKGSCGGPVGRPSTAVWISGDGAFTALIIRG